ncbi:MAG TPA: hypothetical protein VHZ24_02800 [Pirellulales bacterium]|jgi:hypothetical protein|nr:hypothetical protein [Pirellulales bacterium]
MSDLLGLLHSNHDARTNDAFSVARFPDERKNKCNGYAQRKRRSATNLRVNGSGWLRDSNSYVDLYHIRAPFAFQPGDDQDPRDASGNVIYDTGVTLLDTWRALERLVDEGKCTYAERPPFVGKSKVSALPEEGVREISEGIKTRVRFNRVLETGVPGFIPRGEGG